MSIGSHRVRHNSQPITHASLRHDPYSVGALLMCIDRHLLCEFVLWRQLSLQKLWLLVL